MSSRDAAVRTVDWRQELMDQLDWHWVNQARPRMEGLTDDEYFWEPVADCWNIRAAGDGTFTYDDVEPEPDPPPVTTIGWRLGHIAGPVLGFRAGAHFGTGSTPQTFELPGTHDGMLALVDQMYADWMAGVRALDDDGVAAPCGPAEGPFSYYPFAALILHINREVIHHAAEVACLRDLYLHRF